MPILITADTHDRGAQLMRQHGLPPHLVVVVTPQNAKYAAGGYHGLDRVGDSVEHWSNEAKAYVYMASGWPTP